MDQRWKLHLHRLFQSKPIWFEEIDFAHTVMVLDFRIEAIIVKHVPIEFAPYNDW
jgi:hypothetical protein